MSWNYRILKDDVTDPNWVSYSVIEAYYDDEGHVMSYCPASIKGWEDLDDLIGTIELINKIRKHGEPVLVLSELNKEWSK